VLLCFAGGIQHQIFSPAEIRALQLSNDNLKVYISVGQNGWTSIDDPDGASSAELFYAVNEAAISLYVACFHFHHCGEVPAPLQVEHHLSVTLLLATERVQRVHRQLSGRVQWYVDANS